MRLIDADRLIDDIVNGDGCLYCKTVLSCKREDKDIDVSIPIRNDTALISLINRQPTVKIK